MPNFCAANNCKRSVHARGLCNIHYKRLMRHGDLESHKWKRGEHRNHCTVFGCQDVVMGHGLCRKHYQRYRVNGTVETNKHAPHTGIAKESPKEYRTWHGMKDRCFNPNSPSYSDYGGRGITVCDRWTKIGGFLNFLEDMGKAPSKKHSLDRIDVNGDYCPENCRWATAKQQANNRRLRRDARLLTVAGETHTFAEWSKISGVSYKKICERFHSETFDRDKILLNQDLRHRI